MLFVGGKCANALNGGDVTVDLTTLAGGIASSPSAGDIVLAFGAAHLSVGINTAGYTSIYADALMVVSYKIMGATPDTSVVGEGGGNANHCSVYGAMVFREVDPTTPMDATATSATGSTSNPNPPAITPTTNDAAVVIFATSNVFDASIAVPANYSGLVQSTGNDVNDMSGAAAYRLGRSAGVSEDPAAFGTWSLGNWIAVTVALRPLRIPNNIKIINQAPSRAAFW